MEKEELQLKSPMYLLVTDILALRSHSANSMRI